MKRLWLSLASMGVALSGMLMPMAALAASPTPAPTAVPALGSGLVLQTSPLPINLVADPGKSVSADLRVKQSGATDAQLKVSLMKFSAFGEEGKPEILDREPGDDYFDWVKFDKTVFDAPPNVWQTVHMTINVPKTAAFGYYYAVVFSRVGDDVKRDNRTNSIAGATAVLVLLEARNPNANRTLQLSSFSSEHRIYEFLPAKFNVKLQNTGNVHAVPQGDVFIMQGKKQLATLPINSGGGNILPRSKRVYPAVWNDGYPVYQLVTEDGKVKLDKDGNQVRKLSWDPGGFNPFSRIRFGKYTAHVFAIYDDGHRDVPLEADLTFWVIPWRAILVLLLVIGLIGFGVYASVRGTVRGAARGVRRLSGRR
jgi:hypothetical protein